MPSLPVVRVGLIGLGRAAVSLLPSLMAHPAVRVTAVADLRAEARDRFAADFGVTPYAQAEALCADKQVDAVYISTPHQWHAPQTILAAEHGKHVLVEKPMALTIEDCEAMRAAAARAGVHIIVGHTHAFDRPVLKMRELLLSGEMGRLVMINMLNFGAFLYRPRRAEELDSSRGGGIIFNQAPHQIDVARLLAGGLVRTVRSMAWVLDPARPTEGSHCTYLDFADGGVASLVYSGYDFFDTDELHSWIGEEGAPRQPDTHGEARARLKALSAVEERSLKQRGGYAGMSELAAPEAWHQPHFGFILASCEHGDMRPSADGLLVYGESGRREMPVGRGLAYPDKGPVVDELYGAVAEDRQPVHDGAWGEATLEVCLAMLRSAHERREITLAHQVPPGDLRS